MKIRFELTLEIDPESWTLAYGSVGEDAIGKDVESYVLSQITGSAAADEGCFPEVELKHRAAPRVTPTRKALDILKAGRGHELAAELPRGADFARLAKSRIPRGAMTARQLQAVDWDVVHGQLRANAQ